MRRVTRLRHLGFAFSCLTLGAKLTSGQPAATLAHASCSASMSGTMYFSAGFSAPFEKDPRGAEPSYHTMVTWGRAFADYIQQKYGPGSASGNCGLVASLEQAQAGVKARIASAKRLMQKVVATDWVHKSATPSTPQSSPPATSAGQTPQTPNASAQGTTMHAVCWSEFNGPVIYVSQVFDTQMGRPDQGVDAFSPISNEFHQYLKGRYDYKADASRAAHCAGQMSQGGSSAQRSRVMAEIGTGKRVVELEWVWAPDTSEVPRGVTIPQDGGYCTTSGTSATVYVAGPFDLKGRMATFEWNHAFSQFLSSKYGFRGEVNCPIGMPRFRAVRHYGFHVQGARAGNKKVVETGWDWSSAVASNPAAKPNEDKEPARPAAPAATPSQEARAFATKEAPETMAYCQNDRALYRGLDCYKVQRLVYNYRIEHAADGTPEPLATLLEKLDCSSCVDNVRTPAWAKQQAHGSGNPPAVSECVGQRIMAAFLTKPYVNRLMDAYNVTLAACKR
ncbi:MAG: hypothetical protein ACRENH_17400 [Gemmatimonadaceae bacterium]